MARRYDNYGRDQFNIENLHVTRSSTGQEMLTKGLQLLSQRNYQQAIEMLNDAIRTDPSLSDSYYYSAIALLSGKKPRKVDKWTIQDIEEKLNSAIRRDTSLSKCYVLWAIVKHGFYAMNELIEPPPTSTKLFSLGDSIQGKDAREILSYINDPLNIYWLKLYNKFGKAS